MAHTSGSTETLFTEKIRELQRRTRVKYGSQFLLYAMCFFLLLHGLALVFERSGVYRVERELPFYLACGVVALFMAAVLLYIRKLSLAHLLIDIDDRFALQDRLSTAYEYQQSEKQSLFNASLQGDAVRHLNSVEMRELIPFRFSRLYWLLIFAGTANLLLLFVTLSPEEDSLALKLQIREHNSKESSTLTPEMLKQQREREQKKREEEASYQRMREKAEDLQQKDLPPEERSGKLQEMLQEVQAMQERLADAASMQDGSTTIEDLPIRQLPRQQGGMMPKLQRLEKMLQSMLSDKTPGAALDSQELPQKLQKQLSELLEELDAQESDSSQTEQERSASNDAEESQSPSGSSQDGESDRRDQQDESLAGGDDGSSESGRQEGGRMTGEGQEGNMDEQGRMEGERSQASAGSGMSDGQQYPPSDPEKSDGPIRQDRVRTAEQEQYNMHIRSVTKIGKARLPEQNLTRSYRQEVENVLQQEEMPLNYREYIKNYFLSIGLTEE